MSISADSWLDLWQPCRSILPADGEGAAASFVSLSRRQARSGILGPLLKSQSGLSSLNCFISLKYLSLQSCLKLFKLLKTLQSVGVCIGAVPTPWPANQRVHLQIYRSQQWNRLTGAALGKLSSAEFSWVIESQASLVWKRPLKVIYPDPHCLIVPPCALGLSLPLTPDVVVPGSLKFCKC